MNRVIALAILLMVASLAGAQDDKAILQGTVIDGLSGESLAGIHMVVYAAEDHSRPLDAEVTDPKGNYRILVEPGRFYDVYLRLPDSSHNQRTPEAVQAGVEYNMNFKIMRKSSFSNQVTEEYGIWIVAAVAFVFFLIVGYDNLFSKHGKKPSVEDLKKEKEEIEKVLLIARDKYHKREIDEDSFKKITTDKQQRIIEIESKIKGD